MHPPLDRPHPNCEKEIQALRECHASHSKFQFWACNKIKVTMDQCFRREKAILLKELNKDVEETRAREEGAMKSALGRKVTFEEYLAKDQDYQDAMRQAGTRKESAYQSTSAGGHAA